MDWIPLIAATVRLVDLHDSDRATGDSASRFNLYRESQPGNHDGHWLDVGLTIIEYRCIQETPPRLPVGSLENIEEVKRWLFQA